MLGVLTSPYDAVALIKTRSYTDVVRLVLLELMFPSRLLR